MKNRGEPSAAEPCAQRHRGCIGLFLGIEGNVVGVGRGGLEGAGRAWLGMISTYTGRDWISKCFARRATGAWN